MSLGQTVATLDLEDDDALPVAQGPAASGSDPSSSRAVGSNPAAEVSDLGDVVAEMPIEVTEADTELVALTSGYLDGPNGVLATSGEAALVVGDVARVRFKEDAHQLLDDLPEEHRAAFQPLFDQQMEQFTQRVMAHQADQSPAIAEEDFVRRHDGMLQIMASSSDPLTWGAARQRYLRAMIDAARRQDWDMAAYMGRVQADLSPIHLQRIMELAAAGGVDDARGVASAQRRGDDPSGSGGGRPRDRHPATSRDGRDVERLGRACRGWAA